MELTNLLIAALEMGGADVFIVPGARPEVKCMNVLKPLDDTRLTPTDAESLVRQAYQLAANRDFNKLKEECDDDFSFSLERRARFRCNAYRQRGTYAATMRAVAFGLPDPEALHIPKLVIDLAEHRSGLILVTGPAGSGKSTTLACMVDRINTTRMGHIITIEDPIEYLHPHKQSVVSQREVPNDVMTFARALRAALRQAPDVIMVGEMRDMETISTAVTAAETGHLVLSSLHTVGAAKTMDRIIDTFPSDQQQQMRVQLSTVLQGVVSQRLVPTVGGGLAPVFEVMTVTPAIQNMIREGKTYQIDNVIYGGTMGQTMMSMDNELIRLCKAGTITRDTAILYANNQDMMKKRV